MASAFLAGAFCRQTTSTMLRAVFSRSCVPVRFLRTATRHLSSGSGSNPADGDDGDAPAGDGRGSSDRTSTDKLASAQRIVRRSSGEASAWPRSRQRAPGSVGGGHHRRNEYSPQQWLSRDEWDESDPELAATAARLQRERVERFLENEGQTAIVEEEAPEIGSERWLQSWKAKTPEEMAPGYVEPRTPNPSLPGEDDSTPAHFFGCRFCRKEKQRRALARQKGQQKRRIHWNDMTIDAFNVPLLLRQLNPLGFIKGRRATGNCAKHQRQVARAVRRARALGFFSYKKGGFRVIPPFPDMVAVDTGDGAQTLLYRSKLQKMAEEKEEEESEDARAAAAGGV